MKKKSEKCSETQRNRKVIHKGDKEKRIYLDDLELYLGEGWEEGQSSSHRNHNSNSHKGKEPWNKNLTKEEDERVMSISVKNSQNMQGHVPWNKNLKAETDERVKNNTDKSTKTKIDRYGTAFVQVPMTDERREKIGKSNSIALKGNKLSPEKLQIKLTKQYLTRKKNNTFNTSSPEEDFYNQLILENETKTIFRQYIDKDRYPFYCDFYIVEDDLFIELNAHWTHGGKPFDENDPECLEKLQEWKEKAKTSAFYRQAIDTWTVRDVKKQKTAKENNLNYKTIY